MCKRGITALSLIAMLGCNFGLRAQSLISPSKNSTQDAKGIEVELRLLNSSPKGWEFEFTTRNAGPSAVYLMTEPIQSSDIRGAYLAVDEDDSSWLKISVRLFYPPCCITLVKNGAGVKLVKLEPGTFLTDRVTIKFPASETMPPYRMSLFPKEINHLLIKNVSVSVGILPDEEGIREVLKSKRFGYFVNGLEQVFSGAFKGRRFVEIQTVIKSNPIKIDTASATTTGTCGGRLLQSPTSPRAVPLSPATRRRRLTLTTT